VYRRSRLHMWSVSYIAACDLPLVSPKSSRASSTPEYQTHHFVIEQPEERTGCARMLCKLRTIHKTVLYPGKGAAVLISFSNNSLLTLKLCQPFDHGFDTLDFDLQQRLGLCDPRRIYDVALRYALSSIFGALVAYRGG
jgi:hypothetical protein